MRAFGWALGVLLAALEPRQEDPIRRFGDPSPPRPEFQAPFPEGRFAPAYPDEVIVFAGSTNIVLEAQRGDLEARLTLAFRDRAPRFRSMAWEGDTVYEQWRDLNFGDWPAQLSAAEASIVVCGFGAMEALDGPARLEEFRAAYGRLLDRFGKVTRRFALITPPPFEAPDSPHVPDLRGRNGDVRAYAEAIRKLAKERGAALADLHAALEGRPADAPRLTENGLHFTPEGWRFAAGLIARALGADVAEPPEALRREIVEKNRLWSECWRAMNWAFAYGDRTTQLFGQGVGGRPSLVQELHRYKPLIRQADARIRALARGEAPPAAVAPPPAEGGPPALSPQEEAASFRVMDGFEVNLFASEADGVVKPVQIRWDERGRLWAVCIPTYPHLEPGRRPGDFLLVCEDTDRDGRADRFTRFAEGLLMPGGIEFGDGGVYVCDATQLVHLRDTDGDGRADVRRVVLSGFGMGDTHQLLNSPVWSPEGDLWFGQGLHIFSRVETPWGIARLDQAGVWRFNPRRLQLHGFFGRATAGANTWGVGFDDWGQVFHNAGDTSYAFYTVPGMVSRFHPIPHPARLFVSNAKNMGLEVADSTHLPESVRGLWVLNVYYSNEVELHRLVEDGAGFRSEKAATLLKSSRSEFRPVDARMGPDGALYVCDWYNPIIGHYQASYRHPQRDRAHGRIWRVAAKGRPPVRPPDLASMTTPELVGQLRSPERWVRDQARRLLFHRPTPEVTAALDAVDPADERFAGEILGVYQGHEAVRPALLEKLLRARDPRARARAVRAVGRWADRLPDALALLRERAADEHPRVRLEAVVAATYADSPRAIEVAALALDRPRDPMIEYALRQAAHALHPRWGPALAAGELDFGGRAEALAFVLRAIGSRDVAGTVRRAAAAPGLSAAVRESLLALLAEVGEPEDLRLAFEEGGSSLRVLEALEASARLRGKKPAGDAAGTLQRLTSSASAEIRAAAFRLAGAWKEAGLAGRLREAAFDASAPPAVRRAAVEALPRAAGPAAVRELEGLLGVRAVRGAVLAAGVEIDVGEAARWAAGLAPSARTVEEMAEIVTPFLRRQGAPEALAAALGERVLPADAAKLALRVLSGAGRDDAPLLAALQKAAGIRGAAPEYTPELVARLAEETRRRGDPARGREVYASPLANCAACHRIGGQGGTIGPDLSAVGRALPLEHIIESVLWPRRQVKEGYLTVLVLTEDGGLFQGQKVRESAEELVLWDLAADREVRIPRTRVRQRKDAGTAMPEGLTDGMTRQELLDLFRYLSELGR